MPYYVYILRTSKNTLYTGQTKDLEKRLATHKNKGPKSAKYLRMFDHVELVYTEEFAGKSEALKRESQIKKLSKQEKEKLLSKSSVGGWGSKS